MAPLMDDDLDDEDINPMADTDDDWRDASKTGDLHTMKRIAREYPNRYKGDWITLTRAIQRNDIPMIEFLCSGPLRPSSNSLIEHCLPPAIQTENPALVKYLYQFCEEWLQSNPNSCRYLVRSTVWQKSAEVAEFIFDEARRKGIPLQDIKFVCHRQLCNALRQRGSVDVGRFFVQKGIIDQPTLDKYLHLHAWDQAAKAGDRMALLDLYQKGITLAPAELAPVIRMLATNSDVETLAFFMQLLRIKPDEFTVKQSVISGNVEVFKFLYDQWLKDPINNTDHNDAADLYRESLFQAILQGRAQLTKYLLDAAKGHYTENDIRRYTCRAFEKGNTQTVPVLVEKKLIAPADVKEIRARYGRPRLKPANKAPGF